MVDQTQREQRAIVNRYSALYANWAKGIGYRQ